MAGAQIFEELASRPKYLVAIESATMLLITLIAFTGNSLICLAILRNPRLRTATNYLIFTLSATDLITACTTLAVATIVLFNGEWIVTINPLDVSSFPCKLQGILSPALTGFSVHIMALTAINRYTCVAQQRLYSKMFSKRGTCVIVLVDAVILVGLTTFPCPAGLASQSHTRSKTSFVFFDLSTANNSTNDRDLVFGFECPFTFVYYLSMLFPSFYRDKKEFVSCGRSSFGLC